MPRSKKSMLEDFERIILWMTVKDSRHYAWHVEEET